MASSISINKDDARKLLDGVWKKIDQLQYDFDKTIKAYADELFASNNVAFRYITVTGLLAKLIEPQVHPRCLQVQSELVAPYDARSLCHKVIVGFEHDYKGYLFGNSNEPMVGKAARHKEHDKNNPQLRDKRNAALAHDILEYARTANPTTVEKLLGYVLYLGRERGKSNVVAIEKVGATLVKVEQFCKQFLQESDGGARLAAVVGCFFSSLNNDYEVGIYPPNNSDRYAKTVGDVEIIDGEKVITAIECKDRPMNLDDVNHGFGKARAAGVQEYLFICGKGIVAGQQAAIEKAIWDIRAERDAKVIDFYAAVPLWATMLNPARRKNFGNEVAVVLREKMKRDTSANAAANLWNSLK